MTINDKSTENKKNTSLPMWIDLVLMELIVSLVRSHDKDTPRP